MKGAAFRLDPRMFDAALLPGVLASAPDAIVVVDEAGCLRYANRQLAVLFGYSIEEILGQSVEILLPEELRQGHSGHRQNFHRSGQVRPMGAGRELFARRKDGSAFPVEISLSPIGKGEQHFIAAIIRDATERRAAERDLRLARAEADRANQAKSRFLATASHDLRQPLQALALLNGILRRTVQDPAALEAVEQQGHAITTMSRLLNALLDIGRIESGSVQIEITDFELGALLEQLREDFQVLAADKGLSLMVEGSGVYAHTDRTLVTQVLHNLVANAIKYTDRGAVHLRCRPGTPVVHVDVMDTGIGISAESLEHIFDEFFQVETGSHASRHGYGLGLSIAQRIAGLLGLDLQVKSEPGKGSSFTLGLPAGNITSAKSDETGRTTPRAQAHPQGGRCILLVEDDPAVRKAMRVFLKSEGYAVIAAGSLAEAVQLGEHTPNIDLVISDYHLAAARGTEVIAALRMRFGKPLASILMTGDTSSAIRELAQDSQLRIISKPVNAEELLDLIRELMPPRIPVAIT
jgi:two-component system, sensor histidine kinase